MQKSLSLESRIAAIKKLVPLKGALIVAGLLISGCGGRPGADVIEIQKPANTPNAIKAENVKPGTTEWQIIDPAQHGEIEGFASLTSVNRGEDISIFVNTAEPTYMIEVFRMGWYGGMGGRLMMPSIVRSGTKQPIPFEDPVTHLVECQWSDPYVLHIPDSQDQTDWASGIYVVKLSGGTSGKQSYVVFVVRDDQRRSDLFFQSSVTTFEAYNAWGGWSLYTRPRAYMVSFNRPYRQGRGAGDFFEWEYSMVRFLEREGYDVTYSTDVDTHARGQSLLSHKAFLSVGHDEYWSWEMRDNVEAARDTGVSLGFFGANAAYWQIRFEPSSLPGLPDGVGSLSAAPNRTIVCYKNRHLDPFSSHRNPKAVRRRTTVQFRKSPVNRPEDALIGVMYRSGFHHKADIVIEDASSWVFADTGLHNLERLPGLLGYEVDQTFDHAPHGTKRIAHSPYQDWNKEGHYSDMVFYTQASGATVVATGSLQWTWGLDDFTTGGRPVWTHAAVQQATRNILNVFITGAKPAELSVETTPPPANKF